MEIIRGFAAAAWLVAVCATPLEAQQPIARQKSRPWLDEALTAPRETVRKAPLAPRATAEIYGDASYGLLISPTQREQSRLFYLDFYQASASPASDWTGSIAQGLAGTTSPAFRESVVNRINYYRAMAGVPAAIVLSDIYNGEDQQAALMMSANGSLSHDPPSTWIDYTAAGALGAAHSDLNGGSDGSTAIDDYIQDPDANNSEAGHRRWLLYPPTVTMGTGDVDGDTTHFATNAVWVLPDSTTLSPPPPVRDGFVAWPPPGFVPAQLVFPRWSFSYPGADFSAATVAMERGGAAVPVRLETLVGGYGDNTLVWVPDNQSTDYIVPLPQTGGDVTDTVTVANVLINGTAQSFTYQVTVIDPDLPGADHVVPSLVGPAQLQVGQASAYAFNAVPNATGYQWTARAVAPLVLVDNAEAGAGDVTITPAGTDLVTSFAGESGSACYQLNSSPAESMTLNPIFTPAATGSTLTFRSQLDYATTAETARVQISTDNGTTWSDLYSLTGTGNQTEASFAAHTLDLSAYVGLSCQIRFTFASTGDFYMRQPQTGWYLDDITVSGAQTLETSEPTPVPPGQLSFDFTPTNAGTYALQVTPLFFNGYAADAGALTVVNAGVVTGTTAPTILSAATASGEVGTAFTYQISATSTPTSYIASPLPPGLTVDPATGAISGTPEQAGTFTIKLGAANAVGTGTGQLNLTIVAVPTVTLTAAIPSVTCGSGGVGEFMLLLSAPQSTDLVVDYAIRGSATDGVDYTLLNGTKKIKAGKTTKPIKIVPLGDLGGASKKSVKLILEPGAGYTVGTAGKIKVSILAAQ